MPPVGAWKMLSILLLVLVPLFTEPVVSHPFYRVTEDDIDHELALADTDPRIPDDIVAQVEKGFEDSFELDKYIEADSGFKDFQQSEKGKIGQHAANGQKGRYHNAGGSKKGHDDSSHYYNDKNSVVKSADGGDYAVSKSYNSGSHTTGYHNVHHKEEYKKNEKFYDSKDQRGHYRRYGDFGAALQAAAGGGSKGHKYDSGYKNSDYSKDGFFDNGSIYDKLKEYAAKNGYLGRYGHQSSGEKAVGAGGDKKYGFYTRH